MEEKSILNYYKSVLKDNYANFSGRARRKEYWSFALINFFIAIIAMAIDNIVGMTFSPEIPYGPVYVIYALAMFVPGLAVAVRRLHDVGKSGWFMLIALIPIIGIIWLIVLYFTDSHEGSNKWGANPKNPANELESLGTE
jgi:uncharacterized membrane protein YhaH (DUF805 family)